MDILKNEIVENCKLFSQLEKQMYKSFSEHNKLQKQAGFGMMASNISPLFMNHSVFINRYLVTYIRSYDNGVSELYFDEFKNVVNPDLLKNGIFIISGYKDDSLPKISSPIDAPKQMFSSSPNSTLNHTEPLLNATGETIDASNPFGTQLPVRYIEYVNCGPMFTATDVLCGGKFEFHGRPSLLRKAFFSLSELDKVSMVEMQRLCTMYCQWTKLVNIDDKKDVPVLIVPTIKEEPAMVFAMLLYTQRNSNGIQVHRINIRTETNNDRAKGVLFEKRKHDATELSYLATFDILSDIKLVNDEDRNVDETSLKIHFHWSGTESLPFQRPPHSSRIVLEVKITAGEARSPANEVFNELTALDTIANTSLAQMTQLLLGDAQQQQAQSVVEKLQTFKELVSDFSYYGVNSMDERENEEEDDLEQAMSLLIQRSFQRNDHDFTDKLWTFLRQSESSDHLKCYLDEILKSIVNGSLQPAVSPTNETKLAKLIRQMYLADSEELKDGIKERILEFLSTDQSAFNLVSEIGYEKLRKDYFNFFLSKELAPISSLIKLCKRQSGHFDIASLWKLHYCFELVITPSIYLTLSQDCQSMLLKAALEYYTSHDVATSSPVFCMSLVPFHDSSASVHQSCDGRQAVLWQQGIVNVDKLSRKLTSVLHVEISKSDDVVEDNSFEGTVQDSIYGFEDVTTLAWNRKSGFITDKKSSQ